MHERSYNRRSILIYLLFLLFPLCIYIGRLYYLQVVKSEYFIKLANSQHKIYYKISPQRGVIYDRKMRKLATSFDVYSCYANPRKITDKEKAAEDLAAFFDLDKDEVLKLLHKDKAFVWIKRHITEEEAQEFNDSNFKALGLVKESRRFYPDQTLASHIMGFVGIDNEGLEGLELYYNDYLRGVAGLSILSRDAKGRFLEAKEYQISQALDGYNLVLTIDKFIQYVAERELDWVYRKYRAKSASIIIMDPTTGEILALANRPTFNPNTFSQAEVSMLRNRAVCDIFEPGSVFKVIAATCALEEKVVSLDEKIYCEEGLYKVGSHTLHDYKPFKDLTFEEIIQYSSNIGVVKVSQRLEEDTFYDYIKKFGFGKMTGIDLPLEEEGIIRSPREWSKISIAAIPIGQEVAVTTLQMLCAISSIANGGTLLRPHLVKYIIDDQNELIKEFKTQPVTRVCSKETSKQLKRAMTKVVEGGTGKRAKIEGYTVAGKTGTAQKVNPSGGGYSHDKFIASFGGFLPVDNPKIAMIVIVDEPRPVYYGGQVAAPVFKKVAQDVIKYIENYGLD